MAKPCIFCGQILAKDDARYCNDCGRSQVVPPGSSAAPSAIKVKLPPKEFTSFAPPSSSLGGRQPVSEPASAPSRPPLSTPKRPQQTSANLAEQQEATRLAWKSNASYPPESGQTLAEESTMVMAGWEEELAQIRSEHPLVADPSVVEAAPPLPKNPDMRSGGKSSLQTGGSSINEPPVRPGSPVEKAPQAKNPASRPLLEDQPGTPSRRELHVRVWEQPSNSTASAQKIERLTPVPGPAPAIEQTPFAENAFDLEDNLDQIAAFDTVLWPATRPEGAVEDKGRVANTSERRIEGEFPESGAYPASEEHQVEDLPTAILEVPQQGKSPSNIVIERTSTPAPKKRPETRPQEDVEDLPTRPLAATATSPRSSSPVPQTPVPALPATPNPASGFSTSGPRSPFPNPPSFPGELVKGPTPSSPEKNSPVSTGFNQSPTSSGSTPAPVSSQSGQMQQDQRPAGTSRESTHASQQPSRRQRRPGLLVAILLALLIIGVASFFYFYQPFTINPNTQPSQSYQNTALGFSLQYTSGWKVTQDQVHKVVRFADSSQTNQVSLSLVAPNGKTLNEYLSQAPAQFAMTGTRSLAPVTFGGASWQVIQGVQSQSGADYRITLYITQHGNYFYTLAMLAPTSIYTSAERDNFTDLRATFRFL